MQKEKENISEDYTDFKLKILRIPVSKLTGERLREEKLAKGFGHKRSWCCSHFHKIRGDRSEELPVLHWSTLHPNTRAAHVPSFYKSSEHPRTWLCPYWLFTFCLCIMCRRSPKGDSSGLSKASKANVRSISVRHSLLSSPCSASCVWANSNAASVSRWRISSIKCCC